MALEGFQLLLALALEAVGINRIRQQIHGVVAVRMDTAGEMVLVADPGKVLAADPEAEVAVQSSCSHRPVLCPYC